STSSDEWERLPKAFIANNGNTFTEFTAFPSGTGCVGSGVRQSPQKTHPENAGRIWTTATRQDGGIVCSNGTWYLGWYSGYQADVLIKGGAIYVRKRDQWIRQVLSY